MLLKKKVVRVNQTPFSNKEMRKALYTRNSLRNNFWKNVGEPTFFKNQRNKCVYLRKNA